MIYRLGELRADMSLNPQDFEDVHNPSKPMEEEEIGEC